MPLVKDTNGNRTVSMTCMMDRPATLSGSIIDTSLPTERTRTFTRPTDTASRRLHSQDRVKRERKRERLTTHRPMIVS